MIHKWLTRRTDARKRRSEAEKKAARRRIIQVHVVALAIAGILLITFGLLTFGMTWHQVGVMIVKNAVSSVAYVIEMVWGGTLLCIARTPDPTVLAMTEETVFALRFTLILSAAAIAAALIYTTLMKRRQVKQNE